MEYVQRCGLGSLLPPRVYAAGSGIQSTCVMVVLQISEVPRCGQAIRSTHIFPLHLL